MEMQSMLDFAINLLRNVSLMLFLWHCRYFLQGGETTHCRFHYFRWGLPNI